MTSELIEFRPHTEGWQYVRRKGVVKLTLIPGSNFTAGRLRSNCPVPCKALSEQAGVMLYHGVTPDHVWIDISSMTWLDVCARRILLFQSLDSVPPCLPLPILAQPSVSSFPKSYRSLSHLHPPLLPAPTLSSGDTLNSGSWMAMLYSRLGARDFASTAAFSPHSLLSFLTCLHPRPRKRTRLSVDARSYTSRTHRTTSRISSTYSYPKHAYGG